jgi:peptidoglycan L-alanyl-D-glutamate endopeptidase CwlK
MFPDAHLENINKHLPFVLSALAQRELTSVPVVLAALATIRAETAGFVPISEGISRFNTSPGGQPFDLYDHRADLGNRGPTDGSDFKGRGFIQLTGRSNYEQFGPIIGVPTLANQPEQANDPGIAAHLLAAFIKAKEISIKQALAAEDLATARRLVNGGSHGLDQFTEAYRAGQRFLTA